MLSDALMVLTESVAKALLASGIVRIDTMQHETNTDLNIFNMNVIPPSFSEWINYDTALNELSLITTYEFKLLPIIDLYKSFSKGCN